MSERSFILVEFKDGKTSFDISVDNDTQIIIGLAGLEGYLAAQTGLSPEDIRELIDESKTNSIVKPMVKPKTLTE